MEHTDQLSEKNRHLNLPAAELTVLVSEAETNGRFSLIEATVEAGAETSSHWHQETMEAFYVLDGSLTITLDDDDYVLRSGESLFVPPRTVHAPVNIGDEPCRHLLLISPGAFEGFFRERALEDAEADNGPPDETGPTIDIFERYDIYEPPVESPHPE